MLNHEERLFRYIYSMADSRSRLEKTIKSHNEVRMEHLLKLYFYPEDQRDRDGWKRSVYNSLHSVPLLKNNKYPDFQFLFDKIWVEPFAGSLQREMGSRVRFISKSMHRYNAPVFPLDPLIIENCYEICESYSRELAESLSVVGGRSWLSIYTEVELHMKKSIYVKE
jgi:hypothetical protein